MIYTITLNPALDYVVHTPVLRTGVVQRALSSTLTPAGKGINVARMLVRLGDDVQAVGLKAGWTGQAVENAMAAMGCAGPFFDLGQGETRINIKLRHGEETDINLPGPSVPEDVWIQLLHWMATVPKEGDTVVFSGSVPPPLGTETYQQLMLFLQPGVRAVVDAEPEVLRAVLPLRPFLVKPNRDELSGYLHMPIQSRADAVRGGNMLLEAGAQNVLVSMDAEGSVLVSRAGVWYMPPPEVTVCNTVGAGDAMLAGFLHGYDGEGGTEAEKLCSGLVWGTACGAATAASEGIAQAEAVQALLEQCVPVNLQGSSD